MDAELRRHEEEEIDEQQRRRAAHEFDDRRGEPADRRDPRDAPEHEDQAAHERDGAGTQGSPDGADEAGSQELPNVDVGEQVPIHWIELAVGIQTHDQPDDECREQQRGDDSAGENAPTSVWACRLEQGGFGGCHRHATALFSMMRPIAPMTSPVAT
jgi:hypothetical protein